MFFIPPPVWPPVCHLAPPPAPSSVYHSQRVMLCFLSVCSPGYSAVLQSGVRVYLCGFHPRRVSGMIINLLTQRVPEAIWAVCVRVSARVSARVLSEDIGLYFP